ncbi:MAG TPA: hypothetical protein VIZ30_09180 [Pseudomonadales bacterium]
MVSVYAWGVVALAGLGTLAGVFVLTRAIDTAWLRSLLRCLAAVWLMVPSKIQVVDSEYAPAFIVALFEGVFRSDGDPGPALAALTIASLVVIALFLVLGVLRLVRNAVNRRATR